MAIAIPQFVRKINIPLLGEKNVNIPVVAGVSVAAIGIALLVSPTFYTKSTAGQEHPQEGQVVIIDGKKYKYQNGQYILLTDEEAKQETTVIPVTPTTPPLKLYSIVTGYTAACEPRTHLTATKTDWDVLMKLIEAPIKAQAYRMAGHYIANLAGEILPQQGPIIKSGLYVLEEVWSAEALAAWIRQGNIWIDYTQYPMYYSDCQVWISGMAPGETIRWNVFCQQLGIEQLGLGKRYFLTVQNSDFFAKRTFPDFPYDRSLTLSAGLPPSTIFKTSDMIASLQQVPYSPGYVFSMFALKVGNGIYFYSNTKNSPKDYATFILAVHKGQI